MRKISVIIVSYNSEKYIRACLNSIDIFLKGSPYEVLVADNQSQDETVEIIAKEYPEVKLIKSDKNLGFAAANNLAVKHSNGDMLLLLNHDAQLLEPLDRAISLLEQNREIGVIGFRMLDAQKEYALSVGKFPKPWQFLKFTWFKEKRKDFIDGNFPKYENGFPVDWVTGALMLVEKSLYKQVGGMDEGFFLYVEDVDFCKKVWKAGKKVVFYPEISYRHHVGFSPSREIHLINGYKIFSNKYFQGLNLVVAQVALQINHGIKIFKNNIRRRLPA